MVDAVTSPSDPVDSRDSDKSHHWMPIQATYFYPQILLKKMKVSLQMFHQFTPLNWDK